MVFFFVLTEIKIFETKLTAYILHLGIELKLMKILNMQTTNIIAMIPIYTFCNSNYSTVNKLLTGEK